MNEKQNRPNILLIHADQHRADCIGAYGNPDIRTPNIDNLAKDGVLYRNCFCSYPVCTPSRYSLISGLYVHQHLGWTNHSTLPSGIDTFPKILKKHGYHTKAVGKMHYTPTYLDVGFEEMELAEQVGPGRYDDDYHRYLKERGLIDRLDLMDQVKEYREQAPDEYWDCFGAVESDLDEEHYSTTWIGKKALESIEKWGDTPNLLMVGFIKPHHPFDAPSPWSEMYEPDKLTLLPGWTEDNISYDLEKHRGYFPMDSLDETKLRNIMARYYGSISQIDYYVGKMIDLLKKKGIYENTMIIYTSDHGDYMGYHHMVLKGNYMYDPLVKVPLIIKYPGEMYKGIVSDIYVSNIDLAPTILEQAGCKPGEFMRGFNIIPGAKGRDIIFAESRLGTDYMVRTRTHKLLLCKEGRSLFFDLEKDPFEVNNLYDEPNYQEEIENLKKCLAEWVLFESRTPTNLDEYAPTIKGKNVPNFDDGHREEMIEYFRKNMQSAGEIVFKKNKCK